ncbi:MAG: hypothetical protein QOI78_7496 [Actinomycetota bacterium]|jgi:hypothetical protein|nr:hypothetical protein [Actinomycetota bacterium]
MLSRHQPLSSAELGLPALTGPVALARLREEFGTLLAAEFSRQRPHLSPTEFFARFAGVAPRFVAETRDRLRHVPRARLPAHKSPVD